MAAPPGNIFTIKMSYRILKNLIVYYFNKFCWDLKRTQICKNSTAKNQLQNQVVKKLWELKIQNVFETEVAARVGEPKKLENCSEDELKAILKEYYDK